MIHASRCARDASAFVPPRARCPLCGGGMAAVALAAEGELLTWTVVRAPATGGARDAVVALVKLAGAVAAATSDADPARLVMGARVAVEESEDGDLAFTLV